MTFMEIVIHAWTCDFCGLEAIAADDCLPVGWSMWPSDNERHACPVCIAPAEAERVARLLA